MNRKYIVGAVVAALIVVAGLVIFSVMGGDDEVSPDSLEDIALIQEQMEGIPQSGATLGEADAPIEILEFGDLQCPACASSAREVLPQVIERFVRPGTAKLTFVPIAFLGDDSERGALGAEAAARQDAIWPFITALYHNQGGENTGWLSEAVMRAVVEEQVQSTPTFVVRGPDGRVAFAGARDISAFEDAIEQVGGQ